MQPLEDCFPCRKPHMYSEFWLHCGDVLQWQLGRQTARVARRHAATRGLTAAESRVHGQRPQRKRSLLINLFYEFFLWGGDQSRAYIKMIV